MESRETLLTQGILLFCGHTQSSGRPERTGTYYKRFLLSKYVDSTRETLVFTATTQDSQRVSNWGSLALFPSVNFTKAHFLINQLYLFMRTLLMDSSHMDSCIGEVKTCIIADGYALSQLSLTRCQNRQYYTVCLQMESADSFFPLLCGKNLQNRLNPASYTLIGS